MIVLQGQLMNTVLNRLHVTINSYVPGILVTLKLMMGLVLIGTSGAPFSDN